MSILISSPLGTRGAKSCAKIEEVDISIPPPGSSPDRNSALTHNLIPKFAFRLLGWRTATLGYATSRASSICNTESLRNHGRGTEGCWSYPRFPSELLLEIVNESPGPEKRKQMIQENGSEFDRSNYNQDKTVSARATQWQLQGLK